MYNFSVRAELDSLIYAIQLAASMQYLPYGKKEFTFTRWGEYITEEGIPRLLLSDSYLGVDTNEKFLVPQTIEEVAVMAKRWIESQDKSKLPRDHYCDDEELGFTAVADYNAVITISPIMIGIGK